MFREIRSFCQKRVLYHLSGSECMDLCKHRLSPNKLDSYLLKWSTKALEGVIMLHTFYGIDFSNSSPAKCSSLSALKHFAVSPWFAEVIR